MFVNFAVAAATLAQRKAHQKEFEVAIEKMELAAKLDPSFSYPKILLGSYYLLKGEPQRAIDHYMRVIREDPRNGEYWIMLAKVYEYQGMFDLALQNLNEGIRMAPDNRQLYVEGFRLAAQAGQREIAKDFIKRWLDKNPGDQQLQSLYKDIDSYIEEHFGQQEELKNREEQ
jgi:cytochrome c-type biogenesis protein CcmH/NrfG